MKCFSFTRLADLQAQDEAKAAKEKARNNLESHVFEMREMLYGEIGELLSTEEEREKIDQALTETSDWLDDEGWDTTADVSHAAIVQLIQYTSKLHSYSSQFIRIRLNAVIRK